MQIRVTPLIIYDPLENKSTVLTRATPTLNNLIFTISTSVAFSPQQLQNRI